MSETSGRNFERLALRPPEAAAALGISLSELDKRRKNGELPYIKLGPKLVLFPVPALVNWMASRTIHPEAAELDEESA